MMPRTGSIASKVGPAVTMTRVPASALEGRYGFRDLVRFNHAAHARFATGLIAARRANDRNPVRGKLRHVAARCGVLPHLAIHGGRDKKRAFARKAQGREQVIGQAVDEFCNEVRRGGGDDDRILVTRELDVPHVVRHARVPHVREDRVAGECLHGDRRDKGASRFGHHHLDVDTLGDERAAKHRGLVGRDPARYAEQDFFLCCISHVAPSIKERESVTAKGGVVNGER